MRNLNYKISAFIMVLFFICGGIAFAAQAPQQNPPATTTTSALPADGPSSVSQILDRVVGREAILASKMRSMHPIVETYLQSLDKDDTLAFRPVSDQYFLGKLDFNAEEREHSFIKADAPNKIIGKITQLYSVKYLPGGFAQMLVVDGHFDKKNYQFEYVRREFLGSVRTLVFDVLPRKGSAGTFRGRIWVEDQEYNIVRFNGTYGPSTPTKMYFHFDSWRENVGTGVWLPAYVYTEESNMGYLVGVRHLRFKGQTRLWGYNVGKASAQNELTAITVESDDVKDKIEDADEGTSPVYALRQWERQAEDNVIQRLEKAALLAPDGEVNKTLETVVNNLEVTNNLDIEPEVRVRVLLTTPLESFTIGHTIVLSRGLVDVLPDEASLAMVLGHELAHIALGHRLDTMYAFSDRMLFEDPEAFEKIYLKRDPKEEIDADKKAEEFLKNSPYKDKLGNAGLFLEAVNARARQLPNLLRAHIGNTMVKGNQMQRMTALEVGAPKLEMSKVDQIAALPLGGRIRVDPWSAKIDMPKTKAVALLSAREKMPFEVTPFFIYLKRQSSENPAKTAAATPAPQPTPSPTPDQGATAKQNN